MVVPNFKIKSVEPIRLISKEEREKAIKKAGYNLFSLNSEDVLIDLLTDSGTGAISKEQDSASKKADESYAGRRSARNMEETVKDIFHSKYVILTPQGRSAEFIFNMVMTSKGRVVPGNIHFDTTRAHIEHAGAVGLDCVVDDVYDTEKEADFKGNIDLNKLEDCIKKYGRENIPYILITATCNLGGGQPVSLENMIKTREIANNYQIPLFLDAARFAENAYFIKEREKLFKNQSLRGIVFLMMLQFDGCLMSAKKDGISNAGGFIALNNKELYDKLDEIKILIFGFNGGLPGTTQEIISKGLREAIDENYLRHRIWGIKYFGDKLIENNIPIVKPIGGHAIYLDATKILPHIEKKNFPGHALAIELYLEGGIRSCEIGSLLRGRDKEGNDGISRLELTRLAVPRRVYSLEHLDYCADIIKKVYERREKIKGFEFEFEPKILRHFKARVKRLE